VQTYLEKFLVQILEAAPPDIFQFEEAAQVETELAQIERRINALEHQIEGMIVNQATAPEAIRPIYDKQIARAADELDKATQRRSALMMADARYSHALHTQRATYQELKERGVEWFWQQSDRWINQTLHKLFGAARLVSRDKQIVSVIIPDGSNHLDL
jgi:hypothetical protein